MPQKIFEVDGLGPVTVSKRRGARNIRLSISSKNQVRVSLPYYLPFSTGISFALAQKDWLRTKLADTVALSFRSGDQIGKSYRLQLVEEAKCSKIRTRLKSNTVFIFFPVGLSPADIRQAAEKACHKALRADASTLLKIRLEELAAKHGYSYSGLQIKKLTSRWGSCSSSGRISFSLYLIQLPWELIDYVILHELAHTRHMNHQKPFWDELNSVLPDAKIRRSKLRTYKPMLLTG